MTFRESNDAKRASRYWNAWAEALKLAGVEDNYRTYLNGAPALDPPPGSLTTLRQGSKPERR